MVLLTTYLAYLTKIRHGEETTKALEKIGLKNPKVYYVMRNRGNNEVAPSGLLLEWVSLQKEKYTIAWSTVGKEESWPKYMEEYLSQLARLPEASKWIERVAEEALFRDVVLVCFEKDHVHCHRTLLAKKITFLHPAVNYVGELKKLKENQ